MPGPQRTVDTITTAAATIMVGIHSVPNMGVETGMVVTVSTFTFCFYFFSKKREILSV